MSPREMRSAACEMFYVGYYNVSWGMRHWEFYVEDLSWEMLMKKCYLGDVTGKKTWSRRARLTWDRMKKQTPSIGK